MKIILLLLSLYSLIAVAQQRCGYQGVIFNSVADFENITFEKVAVFDECQFDSLADFDEAIFNAGAYFIEMKFNSYSNFEMAHFNERSSFREAHFDSMAYFQEAQFNSYVDFLETQFHYIADFKEAHFDTIADFSKAEFHFITNFEGTELPSYLNFSDVNTINVEIDLTNSRIHEKYGICRINLINSNIDKIKFRYSRFKLYFPINTDPEFKSNVYEKLLEKQRKEGYVFSLEKLDKEYKEFKYKEDGKHFTNFIQKYWWDYGYNKGRIIKITFWFFVIFTIINSIWFKPISTKIYVIPKLKKIRENINENNKVLLPLKVIPLAIFYTGLIFFGIKFNLGNLKYKENLSSWKIFRLIYFFAVYIAGLICLGFLANYVLNN